MSKSNVSNKKECRNGTRLMIVDDHQMFAQAIGSALVAMMDVEIVAYAHTGLEAVTKALKEKPDYVLMDVTLPDLNGIDATRRILREGKFSKIIGVSAHCREDLVREMFRAGAVGFLHKGSGISQFAEAFRRIQQGGVYLCGSVASDVVDIYFRKSQDPADSVYILLTEREREVLQLIGENHATKEIASMLCVSIDTVATHRRNLMIKLRIANHDELKRYAVAEGLSCVCVV